MPNASLGILCFIVCKAGDTPGDFIRRSRRIWSPVKIANDFRWRLMRTHPASFFADRGDVAVLKTHVTKSPNLMGWLYWRFAAINVENPGVSLALHVHSLQKLFLYLFIVAFTKRNPTALHFVEMGSFHWLECNREKSQGYDKGLYGQHLNSGATRLTLTHN